MRVLHSTPVCVGESESHSLEILKYLSAALLVRDPMLPTVFLPEIYLLPGGGMSPQISRSDHCRLINESLVKTITKLQISTKYLFSDSGPNNYPPVSTLCLCELY